MLAHFARRLPVMALMGAVHTYRLFIAPLLMPGCRFAPTCSSYALEALSVHGALRGSALTIRRLLRCHPWGGQGYDPVPHAAPDHACHSLARPR